MAKSISVENITKAMVYSMDAKAFGSFVLKVHKKVSSASIIKNRNYVKAEIPELFKHFQGNVPFFLGSSSAKVLHSAESDRWFNVILYHSPADRSLISFLHEFRDRPDIINGLKKNVKKAAEQDDAWKGFGAFKEFKFKAIENEIRTLENTPMNPNYNLPKINNEIGFLSMCPYASPDCRNVCLNTSGQGGMDRTGTLNRLIDRMHLEKVKPGITKTNDWLYFYLHGYSAFYGGETNSVTSIRHRRTHMMWYIWATEGVLQNSYNNLVFNEALAFKKVADRLSIPMALRLNGTSDIPVHRLRLTNGKNMIAELGKCGIVCYDYTKDYPRMKKWMESGSWKGSEKAVSKKVSLKAGFPTNYHLSFSWSEVNAKLSLAVLKKGFNVVMVFRRSFTTDRKDSYKLPTMGRGKGTLPTQIALSQLSTDADDRNWVATVVNGDATDLRFLDGNLAKLQTGKPSTEGKPYGGIVVGLVAKGLGASSKGGYTDDLRREAWRHFTSPVVLRKLGEEITAEIRHNPPENNDTGAVVVLDPDVAKEAVVVIDGFLVTTTATGT